SGAAARRCNLTGAAARRHLSSLFLRRPMPTPTPFRAPLAYEDSKFLNSPDGRILRILSEYAEPLARFRREKIQDTVVFFGSARFHSRSDAQNALELLEKPGSAKPAGPKDQPGAADADALQTALKRAHAGVQM